MEFKFNHLTFTSLFDSGNLGQVEKVFDKEESLATLPCKSDEIIGIYLNTQYIHF